MRPTRVGEHGGLDRSNAARLGKVLKTNMTRLPLAGAVAGLLLLLTCAAAAPAQDDAQQPFELRDGDTVALIGSTFVEREQVYSYLETLLRSRWPERKIAFRNLGWSGDTVFGHARSYFDPPAKGFERLDKLVHELKPTVIFISYGMGESFDGEPGLQPFRQGFERMLDMLKDLNARTVVIGPTRHEDLGPPLPDPTEHNRHLRLYADAMKEVAAARGHRFIDLYETLGDGTKANPPAPLTDNGIHLTQYGSWRAAAAIEQGLGLPARGWTVSIDVGNGDHRAEGVDVVQTAAGKHAVSVALQPRMLPAPPPPQTPHPVAWNGGGRVLKVTGLPAGQWTLRAGERVVANAPAEEWAKGVSIIDDPATAAAEKAREVAIFKNLQYFNQWRPANETYIFGFRAYEQGKNAAEMPMFNEPIAKLEAEITRLVQPTEITYELKPAGPAADGGGL